MTSATWQGASSNYADPNNWSLNNVPGSTDTAFFGTSNQTSIGLLQPPGEEVGAWVFNPWSSNYNFTLSWEVDFFGAGIIVNGGAANILSNAYIEFFNNSTSGSAVITNTNGMYFHDGSNAGVAKLFNNWQLQFDGNSSADRAGITNNYELYFTTYSTAGNATIYNYSTLQFSFHSSAGDATIYTLAGAQTTFGDSTDAGSAQLITKAGGRTIFGDSSNGSNAELTTEAGGTVDFSFSTGLGINFKLTVGSIAGAGTYLLGRDQLTVGGNGLPTTVSGPIEDGGGLGGMGASLVKIGPGRLTLSHALNTYTGGTTLSGGTLDLAAIGAAGTGDITFNTPSRLTIQNAALSAGHVFGNHIEEFGKNDILDLSGLHFHKGASAKYHPATDVLTVHSGHATDKLTLVSPLETHFHAASDGHGGTDIFLFFA
jgi:autotransporter-associated beta strand protein